MPAEACCGQILMAPGPMAAGADWEALALEFHLVGGHWQQHCWWSRHSTTAPYSQGPPAMHRGFSTDLSDLTVSLLGHRRLVLGRRACYCRRCHLNQILLPLGCPPCLRPWLEEGLSCRYWGFR